MRGDIAVIEVRVPKEYAQKAIPLDWLADNAAMEAIGPGDEMMALGFPRGLSANGAGFPILRSGRVASYPIGPSAQFPTVLLDFAVFPGEQQPVAFARVLVNQPRVVFLDEATSATDEGLEHALYTLLRARLPDSVLVSVGHRGTLEAFHSHRLVLDGVGGWQMAAI